MPDLTELQRLAEGATHAGGGWWHTETLQQVLVPSEASFVAAMSPDTAKKLIAVALAAQEAYTFLADQGKAAFAHGGMPAVDRLNATALALRTALEELK